MSQRITVRRLPLIACVLFLSAAIAVFAAQKHARRSAIDHLREAVARVPAAYALTVGTFAEAGESLTLKDIAFTLPSGEGPFAVTAASASLEGVAFDKLFGDTKTVLIRKLRLEGFSVTHDALTLTSDRYELEDFAANPATLAADLANILLNGAATAEVLKPLVLPDVPFPARNMPEHTADHAISVAGYHSRNDRVVLALEGGALTLSGAECTGAGLSAHRTDRLVCADMWGEYAGSRFFSLEELSLSDIAFIDRPGAAQSGDDATADDDGDTLLRSGNISVKNFHFTPPVAAGRAIPFTLERLRFSKDSMEKGLRFSLAVTALTVETQALASLMVESAHAAQFRDFVARLPGALVADSALAMDIIKEDTAFAVMLDQASLTVKGLGAFSLSYEGRSLPLNMDGGEIIRLECSLTDSGGSRFLFDLFGEPQGKTGEYLRRETRMAISAASMAFQGPLADFSANILGFLEKPGATLRVSLHPAEPLSAEALSVLLLTDPGRVGLSSSLARQ